MRREGEQHGLSRRETLTLLDHVEAITADRDEARAEVAALRAQRDEIREAHRVEVAALTQRATDIEETMLAGWHELASLSGALGYHRATAEDFGEVDVVHVRALAASITEQLDAALRSSLSEAAWRSLTARLEAAERGREDWRARAERAVDGLTQAAATTAALARADAAEAIVRELREAHAVFLAQRDQDRGEVASAKAKLAALVEAYDRDEDVLTRWLRNEPGVTDATLAEAEAALDAAIRAARGEP